MSETNPERSKWAWIRDHINLYLSDPEKAHMWDSSFGGSKGLVATLLLKTRGRKTGKLVYSPLIYTKHGQGFSVIASKGGNPDHPEWYKNLLAGPTVDIQVGKDAYRAKARVAAGAEREKLWAEHMKVYPLYDEYQKRAGAREIPVVVLDPV